MHHLMHEAQAYSYVGLEDSQIEEGEKCPPLAEGHTEQGEPGDPHEQGDPAASHR